MPHLARDSSLADSKTTSDSYDAIIMGAGGAGMMAAIQAGRRSRRVLLIDHAKKLGSKILISGGGRCNFTNLGVSPAQYVSENPHFCKSALSRFTPQDFIEMVQAHHISYHEKKLGQLFCDHSASQIVELLRKECEIAGARFLLGCQIQKVTSRNDHATIRYDVETSHGIFSSESLVVATGGLSIPKIGATGLGYEIAKQFGLSLITPMPALDGFVFSDSEMIAYRNLSGLSLDCTIQVQDHRASEQSNPFPLFRENILFTHSGLSGPAALQASLYWQKGNLLLINLLPDKDIFTWLRMKNREKSKTTLKNLLSEFLPQRFSELFLNLRFPQFAHLPISQINDEGIEAVCKTLHHWKIKPSGTVGYNKAEVTRGGVDTRELSSKTMEARNVPGLYFIGEVVDVTGWLGGYNFQWAWASGWAAGQVI